MIKNKFKIDWNNRTTSLATNGFISYVSQFCTEYILGREMSKHIDFCHFKSFVRNVLLNVIFILRLKNFGAGLGTPAVLLGAGIMQVIEEKMVGDTGFEPVTSTVCKKNRKKRKRKI